MNSGFFMERGKVLRGTALLSFGQVAGYGLSFVRNVILARMLSKADFGLAAAFSMTVILLELCGRISFGRQIIQAKDGDSEEFQATSHSFQLVLGVVGAVLILACSYPIAHIFKAPRIAWAFACLAVVPLARGLEHLDYCRYQRQLTYLPAVLYDLVPQVVLTAAAWPLCVWLHDFRVILYLMLGKAVLGVVMTHMLAVRPYRCGWSRPLLMVMWAFGWPLLLNGFLMFGSQQADQALVGAFLSLEQLATYALALSLVSIPWMIFAQVAASLMLPILSRVQDRPEDLSRQYRLCLEFATVGAVVAMLPLILGGEQLVRLFYGAKYAGAGPIMALLGAAGAVRFLRFAPAVAAMARADTVNQLYSNLWRGLSFPLAGVFAVSGGGLILIAASPLIAELIAGTASLVLLRRRQGVPLRYSAAAVIYCLGFVLSGLVLVMAGASRWKLSAACFAVSVGLVGSVLLALVLFPSLSRVLINCVSRGRGTEVRQISPTTAL